MSSREYCVAVVGATGAVGREMIRTLDQRKFPISDIRMLASERSLGEQIEFAGEERSVEVLGTDSFRGVDFALFSAGSGVSKEYAPIAVEAGAVVIDNSSAFRMVDEIPLIVPEANGDILRSRLSEMPDGQGLLIANPNCAAIQLLVVLRPIQDAVGVKRVVMSTYQSCSGAGQAGMDELWNQTMAIFNQQELKKEKFPHQIAFNCIPHIDVFDEDGYTFEEKKIIEECRKVMGRADLPITVTSVRVPVFSSHSESVNIETEQPLSADAARELLSKSPGILVHDEVQQNKYPTGVEVGGTDSTYVGRIRQDQSVENGLNMWIVADNLRKGAALNAVQIAEVVVNARN